MAESDIEQAIKQSAQGPAKASGDSGSVEQHGLAEQIEADRYLENKKASRGKAHYRPCSLSLLLLTLRPCAGIPNCSP